MAVATSRGAVLGVAAGLIVLFTATALLTGGYRSARLSRADARYQDGLALARLHRTEAAAEEFRAALTYMHNDPRYRLALARSLMDLGRWNEAESYLAELRQDDPTSGVINLMLARVAARQKRPEEAVQYYHRAIYGYWPDHADENRASARFELIDLLSRTGQENAVLAELLELSNDLPESDLTDRRRAAALLLAHGSAQHAAELYRGILALEPHDAASHQGLGDAEFARGDFQAARNEFRAAARYGKGSEGLARRLDVVDRVLDLDPTAVRLSGSRRLERARELLRGSLEALKECASVPPDLAGESQQALSPKAERHEGASAEVIALAEKAWTARQQSCAGKAPSDEALAVVMARIQKP